MTELITAIKILIVEALSLDDVAPDAIDSEAPLFGEGLGLDSIDALELGMALKQKYGINLTVSDPATKAHFFSVSTLAALIASQTAT